MKRFLLIASLLFLTGTATAVVGYDGPEDKPHIMSGGSSASSSVAVGPNGTEYRSTVKMRGRSSNVSADAVIDINRSQDRVSFKGKIQTPTPCHVIEHEVEKTGNKTFLLNVETVKENSSKACVQQSVMIDYEAEFEEEPDYRLLVMHDGEEVKEIENPSIHNDRVSTPLKDIMDWFENFL